MHIKTKKSVTLMELIVVVVIISIFATIGLSKYQKTIQISRERDAKTMLLLIKTGQNLFNSKNGEYFPKSGDTSIKDITNINATLELSIMENTDSVKYICNPKGGVNFNCTASYPRSGAVKWQYLITKEMDVPACTGTCYLN